MIATTSAAAPATPAVPCVVYVNAGVLVFGRCKSCYCSVVRIEESDCLQDVNDDNVVEQAFGVVVVVVGDKS